MHRIEELAKTIGQTIVVNVNSDSQLCVSLSNVELKDFAGSYVLGGICGHGSSYTEALDDFYKRASSKILVVSAMSDKDRKEYILL